MAKDHFLRTRLSSSTDTVEEFQNDINKNSKSSSREDILPGQSSAQSYARQGHGKAELMTGSVGSG